VRKPQCAGDAAWVFVRVVSFDNRLPASLFWGHQIVYGIPLDKGPSHGISYHVSDTTHPRQRCRPPAACYVWLDCFPGGTNNTVRIAFLGGWCKTLTSRGIGRPEA